MKTSRLKVKRALDPIEDSDGYRVLVERSWPRGIKKERLLLDDWAKEIAPSKEICIQLRSNEIDWNMFCSFYLEQLKNTEIKTDKVINLAERLRIGPVCLLYSGKDTEKNSAVALKAIFSKIIK